jgi:hypothetical protein
MAVIGETLEEEGNIQSVCGVVLSTRETGDNIQLWLDGGYRARQRMKQSGKHLTQPIADGAEASRGIMSKLRNMLFPGETHEIFTFTPQYRVVPNQSMAGPEKRISQDDGRGSIGRQQQWGAYSQLPHQYPGARYGSNSQQHNYYSSYNQQQYFAGQYGYDAYNTDHYAHQQQHAVQHHQHHQPQQHCQPQPDAAQQQPSYPKGKRSSIIEGEPQHSTVQKEATPPADAEAADGKPIKGTADNEEYRLEKQRQIRQFLTDAEANPGKFTKREIRNSKRQLAMLERRQAQMEAERAGLTNAESKSGESASPEDGSPAAEGEAVPEGVSPSVMANAIQSAMTSSILGQTTTTEQATAGVQAMQISGSTPDAST